ncbi:CRISPR-associated exonuclease, Cas4 family [Micromonospora pattaloongensis]|uniref:CRISPR-associated exonuclease, Cas4 family n=1 Tax=Micromonospora pattaloongensis TaxID=405436 RepID=A0A1H3RFT9_9ACTN|nr:Dna2/Cas4 domain-containing protein [Micromonospora pattaloongensis]SDZ24101.1 CRISPR-associated exonuclease, Cas4 family [Micromonospora pattaloongensis]
MTDDHPADSGTDLREVPLSALEHYAYCHRQTALIHVEGVWSESVETVRGDLSHTTVDLPGIQRRRGLTVIRSLPVWSHTHGLRGICDIVEFEKGTATPVEYKVGHYKAGGPAELQLGGQALCLLEAGFDVPTGYIYSVAERRRHAIPIDTHLLDRVVAATVAVRRLLDTPALPGRAQRRPLPAMFTARGLPARTDRRPAAGHTRPVDPTTIGTVV